MLRVPLHELCLQIKLLQLGEIEPFLSKALEPPEATAVREAEKKVMMMTTVTRERQKIMNIITLDVQHKMPTRRKKCPMLCNQWTSLHCSHDPVDASANTFARAT